MFITQCTCISAGLLTVRKSNISKTILTRHFPTVPSLYLLVIYCRHKSVTTTLITEELPRSIHRNGFTVFHTVFITTKSVSKKRLTRTDLLKPTGHVMHQQFNIKQLYVLPTLYLCVLYLSENKQRPVPLTA